MKLGQKVKCYGYLQKNKKCIYVDSKNDLYTDDEFKNRIDNFDKVKVKDIKKCKEFNGFICGKKNVHTSIYGSYEEPEYGSPYVRFYKDDYIKCYEICFEYKGRWCKRIVPLECIKGA